MGADIIDSNCKTEVNIGDEIFTIIWMKTTVFSITGDRTITLWQLAILCLKEFQFKKSYRLFKMWVLGNIRKKPYITGSEGSF